MLEIKEILSKLEYNTGSFPREAVTEAIRQKDTIVPELLAVLQHAAENITFIEEHPDYMLHIYAMFLLAQFREKRAYPLIVKLFSYPGVDSDAIAGDFVTEDLPRVLASVCDGDTTLIEQLIENREVDEWVRVACVHALVVVVACGVKSRETVMEYYKTLFQGKLERNPNSAWGSLVACCCDLGPDDVYEDITRVFQEDLVDSFFIDLEYVQQYLGKSWSELQKKLQDDCHNLLIEDTIEDMEWWACFQPEEKRNIFLRKTKIKHSQEQKRRTKTGRNQPCPCGSGKKYKKCCGAIVKTQQKR